jgi:aconitate hydratase
MNAVESTPEMAKAIFERMEHNLSIVRKRLNRPLTLSEKLILGHLDDAQHQEMIPGESYLLLRPDRVVLPDAIGQLTLLQFMQTGQHTVRLPATVHCDHLTQAQSNGTEDLARSLQQNNEVYEFLRSASAKYGAGFWAPGAGIAHQVVLENYAFPGALILGTDSHTPNAGGLGACAVAVGGTEAAEALAGLPWELRYPKRIAVLLTGALNGWASPKDVILWVAGQLTVSGGTNAVIEYIGPGARSISATGKATIANMGAEVGATTSLFAADERMKTYLAATGRGALSAVVDQYRHLLEPDTEVVSAPEQYYDRVIHLDLSTLEPHVTGPHSPDRTRPISALAAEFAQTDPAFPAALSAALIGSCTNSSYEDMSRSAQVAEQATRRGLKSAVQFLITPGSEKIRATTERDGQMQSLQALGGTVLANACGPCIGQWKRDDKFAGLPNSIVTSYNRNYSGRNDGHTTTLHFMASPEIVTAFALAGRLTFNPMRDELQDAQGQPFKLMPPGDAPEVPSRGFADSGKYFTPPPTDGRAVEVVIHPASERLQLVAPWKAWQENDFSAMPVLIKTKGKTTTDQIAPAGPWMRYRGHIGKSSEGMLIGGVNAYTGETGKVTNVLSGERSQPIAKVARAYQAGKQSWVIIGGNNYGEGSSREHAAITPRYLGCAAVIARSFARIHESNLKKQGLLALTFRNPDDYDRIREDDRISLPATINLVPGADVECVIKHADGSQETVKLAHTLSEEHIRWFRAGSALNALNSK